MVSNLPGLEAAAAGDGFLNQFVDWDHVVRRIPLILRLGNKPYPSPSAETLRVALGASSYAGRGAGANAEKSFGEKTGLTAIGIGQLAIPTDPAGRVWLHYALRRRASSRRFTTSIGTASPSSRSKSRRPTGTVFSPPRRNKRALPQRGQHIGADKRDPLIATVETSCVELRVFADH